jgi:hypothetical protein
MLLNIKLPEASPVLSTLRVWLQHWVEKGALLMRQKAHSRGRRGKCSGSSSSSSRKAATAATAAAERQQQQQQQQKGSGSSSSSSSSSSSRKAAAAAERQQAVDSPPPLLLLLLPPLPTPMSAPLLFTLLRLLTNCAFTVALGVQCR